MEAAASPRLSPPHAEPEPRRHGAPEHPGAHENDEKTGDEDDQWHQWRKQAKENADHPDGDPSPGEKTQQVSQAEPCRGSAQPLGGRDNGRPKRRRAWPVTQSADLSRSGENSQQVSRGVGAHADGDPDDTIVDGDEST